MVARDHCFGAAALALVLLLATCTPAAAQLVNPRLRVTLPGGMGSVRGSSCPNSNAGASYRFLGIPYAQAPTGARRFAAPVAAPAFTSDFDARNPGAYCPQDAARGLGASLATSFSEDCLTINIWAPQNITGGRAVRVFVHGGGLSSSSGAWPAFDGCANVRDAEIVSVTINYRLGVLGFLGLPALSAANSSNGNWGLMDVHLALQWVQNNIAAFGGDPSRVTLHAQSGGGVLALATMVSPAAMTGPTRDPRWFQRVVLTSPTAYTYNTLSDVYAQGQEFAGLANCSATDLACLRALSVADVIATQRRMQLTEFGAAVDGVLVPDSPFALMSIGRSIRAPVLVTVTNDEANLAVAGVSGPSGVITQAQAASIITAQINPPLRFVNRILAAYDAAAFNGSWFRAASAAITESRYHCGTAQLLNLQSALGVNVYGGVYNMPQTNGCPYQMLGLSSNLATSLGPLLGAIHGADLASVFELPVNSSTTSAWNCGFTDQEVQMAGFLAGSIANFVQHGTPLPRDSRVTTSPALAAVTTWPQWQANFGIASGDDLLNIDINNAGRITRPDAEAMRCSLWDEVRMWMDENGRYGVIPSVQAFINNRSDLTLIGAALRATGDWNSLAGGSNTYFLPNDAAITNLMNSLNLTATQLLALPTLRDILRYHILPMPIDVIRGQPPRQRVIMANGRPAFIMRTGDIVRVLDGNLNGSLVLNGSATIAGRSYVNIIDRVLMNPTCSA